MSLYKKIVGLKNSCLKKEIKLKLKEFKKKNLFLELCFCILVANTNLEKTKGIWERNKTNLIRKNTKELKKILKKQGYRFHNRAPYIILARNSIKKINFNEKDELKLREQLVKNIKGLGYKEASHFLRNLGYKNFAILDRHVLKILSRNNFITMPKTLSRNKYLEIENKLKVLAKKLKISMAELDIYLFYLDSGKVCQK